MLLQIVEYIVLPHLIPLFPHDPIRKSHFASTHSINPLLDRPDPAPLRTLGVLLPLHIFLEKLLHFVALLPQKAIETHLPGRAPQVSPVIRYHVAQPLSLPVVQMKRTRQYR